MSGCDGHHLYACRRRPGDRPAVHSWADAVALLDPGRTLGGFPGLRRLLVRRLWCGPWPPGIHAFARVLPVAGNVGRELDIPALSGKSVGAERCVLPCIGLTWLAGRADTRRHADSIFLAVHG